MLYKKCRSLFPLLNLLTIPMAYIYPGSIIPLFGVVIVCDWRPWKHCITKISWVVVIRSSVLLYNDIVPLIDQLKTVIRPKLACGLVYEIFHTIPWLATSAQHLMLLAFVRNKPLCQAPLLWCHNAIPSWRHIQNITGFWNYELDSLKDVKVMGKYWLNFVDLI